MNYSPTDEFNRRRSAREADHRRRIAAVVWDPNGPEIQIASEVVELQLEAEAVEAAKVRAEAYAAMSARVEAEVAARRAKEGWVPPDSVTIIDDDDENVMAPAGPEPPGPQRQRTPLQEQANALFLEYEYSQRGCARSRSAARFCKTEADFERELLMERAQRNLAAGVVDDEESPFF